MTPHHLLLGVFAFVFAFVIHVDANAVPTDSAPYDNRVAAHIVAATPVPRVTPSDPTLCDRLAVEIDAGTERGDARDWFFPTRSITGPAVRWYTFVQQFNASCGDTDILLRGFARDQLRNEIAPLKDKAETLCQLRHLKNAARTKKDMCAGLLEDLAEKERALDAIPTGVRAGKP